MTDEQQKAQYLYLHTDFTQKEIAEQLDIDRKTLYNWMREGNWKRARYIVRNAPVVLVEQYYNQLGAINRDIENRQDRPYPTKEESEIMRKLATTIKSVAGDRRPVSDNIELFSEFTTFLKAKGVAKQMMPYMNEYIQSKVREADALDFNAKGRKEDKEYENWLTTEEEDNKARNAQKDLLKSIIPAKVIIPKEPENKTTPDTSNPNASDSGNDPHTHMPLSLSFQNGDLNGETTTPEKASEPLPVSDIKANDNADLSTMAYFNNGENVADNNENSATGLSVHFRGLGADYYTILLEERYKISQDPAVVRYTKGNVGITIVQAPSDLLKYDNLFFKTGNE